MRREQEALESARWLADTEVGDASSRIAHIADVTAVPTRFRRPVCCRTFRCAEHRSLEAIAGIALRERSNEMADARRKKS